MIAAHKDTPAQVLPTNQNIHPGHSILIVRVGFGRDLEEFVERCEADVIHVDIGIRYGLHTKFRP